MSTIVVSPDPKQIQAMAPFMPAAVEEVRGESHEAQVKRIAADLFRDRIKTLDPQRVIDAIRAVTPKQHGALLRAAFQESAEAFGDALMTIIVREFEVQAELDAYGIAERVRGAEQSRVHRVFKIVGDC